MNQLLSTEFSQELLRMNIQWWTEFRAALPAELRYEATADPCPVCLEGGLLLQGPLSRGVFSINSAKRLCRHRVCADCYNQMAQPTGPSAEQIGRFFGGLSVETESLPNRVQLNSINVMEGWSSRLEVLGTRVRITGHTTYHFFREVLGTRVSHRGQI